MNWLTRIALTLAILPFAACGAPAPTRHTAALSTATVREMVRAAAPGGTVKLEGRDVKYKVLHTTQLSDDSKTWTAMVINFPDLEMTRTALNRVLSGGECACSQPPVLIVANEEDNETYSTVIDMDIVRSELVTGLEHGDFMGSGSELSLSFGVHFCNSSTPEHLIAERRYVFTFPKLDPLAALDVYVLATTPDATKKTTYQLSTDTGQDGKRGLVHWQEGTTNPVFLDSRSPKESRIIKSTVGEASISTPLSEEKSPATFSGRVLDERGHPVAGIDVRCITTRTGIMVHKRENDVSIKVTDTEGRFEAPVGNELTVIIETEGYEPYRQKFHPAKYNTLLAGSKSKLVTYGVMDLLLLDKNIKVEVWDTGPAIVKRVGAESDKLELGIKFYPTREENKSNPLEVTALADIVFEFRNLCEPNSTEEDAKNCPWDVVVRGQHGWELVPTESDLGLSGIGRAAETGYKEMWSFSNKGLSRHFYLRKDNGERYGILGDFSYSYMETNEWEFKCRFVVQAKPVGTRSLVHEDRPYVEPTVQKPRKHAAPTSEATGKTP